MMHCISGILNFMVLYCIVLFCVKLCFVVCVIYVKFKGQKNSPVTYFII